MMVLSHAAGTASNLGHPVPRDEVGVARVQSVLDSRCTQTDEAGNLPVLVVAVQVEAEANRFLGRRLSLLQ